ncbi:MAG: hypothetical protein ACP5G7_02880, partial [Anaerolineae bacterium]
NYGVAPDDDLMPPIVQEGYAAGTVVTLPVREQDVHEEVLQLVREGDLNLADWISHVMPLERIHEAFRLLAERQATKIVLTI